jgi:DNA topoisomerase-1
MDVVVVESPTKAKTINKYLGEGFKVLSSYGHVRDLPEKDGSVRPDEDFAITYEPLADRRPRLKEIAQALKGADRLWLATDPDREGEAISWHLVAALHDLKALRDVDVKRVVFHEITRQAVEEAMRHPRTLDDHLIDAYQARRALDYLVGFTLSPVLWRKLQGSRSAGRVQSVALRLICEREDEIEAFRPQEYWTVETDFLTERNDKFTARLTRLEGRKLERFDLGDEAATKRAVAAIETRQFRIDSVERKQAQRHPAPPFATSTLQQEAARKLGFSASRTMQVAQRLFEGIELGGETTGLITYMRTDSVQLSGEAIGGARRLIGRRYGERYLPEQPRQYRTRTKNAQEAHEAIRPTDMFRTPDDVGRFLEGDQRRLYELIWQRTVASQMASAILDRTTVDVGSPDGQVGLRATGTIVVFDGFFKVYQEGRDDPDTSAKAQRADAAEEQQDDAERRLPEIAQGERAERGEVRPEQHFTQPPPRYTEASLVKKLEELGIGRPSTYASIISVLQDRGYVLLDSKRFVPEDRGRLVSAFLTSFFDRWVQPGFTAELEDRLDQIAGGDLEWKQVLRDFWGPFAAIVDEVKERRVADVIDALNLRLADHLFPPRPDGGDPRACPLCGNGTLSLKLGRYGAFVGCSNYPECRFTRPLGTKPGDEEEGGASKDRLLGVDENGFEIWLKHGRFGAYVERADEAERKRASLPPGLKGEDVTLERALALLALPREVCRHRETGKPVVAGINRFGPYLQHDGKFVRLPPDEDVLTVGENRALTLLASSGDRRRAGPKVLREVGAHPADGQPIQLFEGRFGPYLKHGGVNASLPKKVDPATVEIEQAVALLAERAAKSGNGKAKAGKRKPAAKSNGNGAARAGRSKSARSSTGKAKSTRAKAPAGGGKRAGGKAEGSKPS